MACQTGPELFAKDRQPDTTNQRGARRGWGVELAHEGVKEEEVKQAQQDTGVLP